MISFETAVILLLIIAQALSSLRAEKMREEIKHLADSFDDLAKRVKK